jgi:hypothetical protein
MSLPILNFVVTIDTEEDNWGYKHSEFSVENIRMIPRLQDLLDRYNIKPTYLVSYKVADCNWAANILAEILALNRCEIGAHLHPWNTPPLKESINERNSMLKNLPYELQLAKLNLLTDKIHGVFGRKPLSFRAGRWGLGAETVKALINCGYLVDTSVTPTISWTSYGDGPEYPEVRTEPHRMSADGDRCKVDDRSSILEFPTTIGFNRWPFEFWQKVYLQMGKDWLRLLKPIGIMNRTGLLRKIWLSPEISSAADMITLSKVMIRNNLKYLNLSFHSTTLLPGKSPFVKNDEDLEQFYLKIEKLLEYLIVATNLNSLTLSEVGRLYLSK